MTNHHPTVVTADHLQVSMSQTAATDGSGLVHLDLNIEPGWKLFGRGSVDGFPVSVSATPPEVLADIEIPVGELTGHVELTAIIRTPTAGVRLELLYQLCSASVCLRPSSLHFDLATVPQVEAETSTRTN